MKKVNWPDNKEFAFTIVDDTDNSTIQNVKPVYDLLIKYGLKTTKTVWIYEPKDKFSGSCLKEKEYSDFIFNLVKYGFEIGLHNVGSGVFKRNEIIEGLEFFNNFFGHYPELHINHASNKDNLYWGNKRYGSVLKGLFQLLYGNKRRYYGDEKKSAYFWGDYSKKHIKYIRNRVFNGINTLKYDPEMPFTESGKDYSNYWFSSSDGHTVEEFNALISKSNIQKLKKENGLCIVYTHFASGFVDGNGLLNPEFEKNMKFLSEQNAWFVPAGTILDFLIEKGNGQQISSAYINRLDIKWLTDRIIKKLKYGR